MIHFSAINQYNTYTNQSLQPNTPAQQLNNLGITDLNTFYEKFYPDLTPQERNCTTKTRNELLFNQGKFLQLAKYGSEFQNCEDIYVNYKDNKDFDELKNSKFFKNPQGFVTLVNSLKSLQNQRYNTAFFYYPTGPYCPHITRAIDYSKYNMNDYLRMLNDFTKNEKISDDLKEYILKMKADKLDIYYTKLDKLNSTDNPVKILSERISYSNE